ncbi:alpha/beta hydrolase fold-3 domain-containing protein [Xylariaceae sp. FL0594]|nr:alpha/beta hydrolase fold-3 domain-containing protein [Xylariaceae sp. FL0594]
MSMGAEILRAFFHYFTTVRFQRPPQPTPGKLGGRFVLIEQPPTASLFTGILTPRDSATPKPVGALWHPAPVRKTDPDLKSKKVCIAATGGAFVLGWDPQETGGVAAEVLISSSFGATNVLYVQYRLAGLSARFPAALQDLTASYKYVLDLGVSHENITLVGDSAGGNHALALLRHLEAPESVLPQPGCALLFSPWVEPTVEAVQTYEQSAASKYDVSVAPLLRWGIDAYRPDDEISEANAQPYLCPLRHPFATKTPLFICAGGREGLLDSIASFAEAMARVPDNRVRFHCSEHMPHDFFLTYPVLGVKDTVCGVLQDAREFWDGCLRE